MQNVAINLMVVYLNFKKCETMLKMCTPEFDSLCAGLEKNMESLFANQLRAQCRARNCWGTHLQHSFTQLTDLGLSNQADNNIVLFQ